MKDFPDNQLRLFSLTASPLQPFPAVFQYRQGQNIAPESLAQRERMAGTVSYLRETSCPMHKTGVDLLLKVHLWAVSDSGGTYGMNYLHEKDAHVCGYMPKGPVQYVFLREMGAYRGIRQVEC